MNHYVHQHGAARDNHATRTAETSAAFLLPHLRADTLLLDVGCGPGTITADLARHIETLGGQAAQVTGVDSAAEALASAPAGPTFVEGDANSLPFPDDQFDVVYAHQLLHHLPNPVAAIREFRRVAKPGGVIAVREADYGAMTWYPLNSGLTRWRAVFSVILEQSDGHATAGRELPTWTHGALMDDRLADLSEDHGHVEVTSSMWTYGDAESRSWLADSWIARTNEDSYATQAAAALGEFNAAGEPTPGPMTTQAIKQITAGWTKWRDTPGAVFLMPHVEVLARV